MPRDEYNSVNITNDRQVNGTEFGNFSRFEYTITSENSIHASETNTINKTELNEITQGDSRDNDDIDKQLTQRERDLIEDAANGNSGSSASASSGGSSSSASSSSSSSTSSGGVSASSGSASGATGAAGTVGGAAAAGSAVAASAVVVTAFAVVAATPILLSNARINDKTLVLTPTVTEMSYSLELLEPFDDEQYYVTVTNETYDQTQRIVAGKNEGTFSGLTGNTRYEFVVIEGTENEIARILYRDYFKTLPESVLVSEVRGATLSTNADFVNNTFDVTLDYVDELNKYSNFAVTLTKVNQQPAPNGLIHRADGNPITSDEGESVTTKTFALEKTTATQTIQAGNDFKIENGSFTYSFSYESTDNPGQAISIPTSSSTVTFVDNVHQSVVNSATLLQEADFRNTRVTVNLDFVDDYHKLSNFKLMLQEISLEPDSQPDPMYYSLQPIVGNQTVDLINGENETSLLDRSFNYMITYDSTDYDIEQVAASGQITFTDSTFFSEFYGASISSVITMTYKYFTVELNFQDDYWIFYSIHVTLTRQTQLSDQQQEYSFELGHQTEPQQVEFPQIQEGQYSYVFTYMRYDDQNQTVFTAASGTVRFDDPDWVPSTAIINGNGVTFLYADYTNKTVTIQLDYEDEDDFISEFTLTLTDNKTSGHLVYSTTDNSLLKTTDPQTLSLGGFEGDNQVMIDVSNTGGFAYTLSWVDNGESDYNEILNQTVADVKDYVNGINFAFDSYDSGAVPITYEQLQFSFTYNDYFDNLLWSGFELEISTPEEQGGQTSGQLTQTYTININSAQGQTGHFNVSCAEQGGDYSGDYIDFLSGQYEEFNYAIKYLDPTTSEMFTFKEGTVQFVDGTLPQWNGVFVGELIENPTGGTYYLPIKLDYNDEYERIDELNINIVSQNNDAPTIPEANFVGIANNPNDSIVFLDNDWQIAEFSFSDVEDFLNPNGIDFVIVDGNYNELYRQSMSGLTLQDSNTEFDLYGIRIDLDGYIYQSEIEDPNDPEEFIMSYNLPINFMYNGEQTTNNEVTLRVWSGEDYADILVGTLQDQTSYQWVNITNYVNYFSSTFSLDIIYVDNDSVPHTIHCYSNISMEFSGV